MKYAQHKLNLTEERMKDKIDWWGIRKEAYEEEDEETEEVPETEETEAEED
jgi:hypothetical protein